MIFIQQLVDLLIESRQLPEGIEWEDERTIATLKIMEFLKIAQQPEPYIAYIHQLCKQHDNSNRLVEAGLTLLLHANLLSWSDKILPSQLSFPEQKECKRKEILYSKAISYFNDAKEYERAIVLLEELANHYKSVQPDYKELSSILIRQSEFYDQIIKTERYAPAYFRVCFHGKGFPSTLRNYEFVYRGFECERITAFIARMKNLFPMADILHSQEELTNEQRESDGQFMVIHTVYVSNYTVVDKKIKNTNISENQNIPSYIREYKQYNNVNIFTYSRPFRKTTKGDKENEFKVNCNEFLVISNENFNILLSF